MSKNAFPKKETLDTSKKSILQETSLGANLEFRIRRFWHFRNKMFSDNIQKALKKFRKRFTGRKLLVPASIFWTEKS